MFVSFIEDHSKKILISCKIWTDQNITDTITYFNDAAVCCYVFFGNLDMNGWPKMVFIFILFVDF
jgi:hypothetical protein